MKKLLQIYSRNKIPYVYTTTRMNSLNHKRFAILQKRDFLHFSAIVKHCAHTTTLMLSSIIPLFFDLQPKKKILNTHIILTYKNLHIQFAEGTKRLCKHFKLTKNRDTNHII